MVMVQFKVFALFGGTKESDEKEHLGPPSLMADIEPGTPRLRITGTHRVAVEVKTA
jgi:hypothetical protein